MWAARISVSNSLSGHFSFRDRKEPVSATDSVSVSNSLSGRFSEPGLVHRLIGFFVSVSNSLSGRFSPLRIGGAVRWRSDVSVSNSMSGHFPPLGFAFWHQPYPWSLSVPKSLSRHFPPRLAGKERLECGPRLSTQVPEQTFFPLHQVRLTTCTQSMSQSLIH